MATCPFNKGFSKEKCTARAENLEHLLGHVRKAHGAIAWDVGTLQEALRRARNVRRPAHER